MTLTLKKKNKEKKTQKESKCNDEALRREYHHQSPQAHQIDIFANKFSCDGSM